MKTEQVWVIRDKPGGLYWYLEFEKPGCHKRFGWTNSLRETFTFDKKDKAEQDCLFAQSVEAEAMVDSIFLIGY